MENITLVVNKHCQQPLQLVKFDHRPPSSPTQVTLGTKVLSAGIAACIADLLTFPLDTAKVRLQIQGEVPIPTTGAAAATDQAVAKKLRYRGLIHTICTISRQEGPRALYNGLCPGLQRQMCFASVRIGLYDSVKQTYFNLFGAGTAGNVGLRILAGVTTGGMAVLCAQPTDVVKVRFQAQLKGSKRYSGVFNAYRTIGREEGFRGLWKGSSANIARNAIVNATELVSYDLIKMRVLATGLMTDNMPCHFVSAFGAGFCTTVMASPVDVVKTRFMNSGAGSYNGVIHCAVNMYKNEGVTAFYKGFWPSFMRLGSWNILMFVCFEQLKRGITRATEVQSPLVQLPIEIKTGTSRYI